MFDYTHILKAIIPLHLLWGWTCVALCLCLNVNSVSFDECLTKMSPFARRQLKRKVISEEEQAIKLWLKIYKTIVFFGITCTHDLCTIEHMYKVYKVNFVFMLTLSHSSESNEFPDSRRMPFDKKKKSMWFTAGVDADTKMYLFQREG